MAKETKKITLDIDSGKCDSLEKIAGAYGKNLSMIINEAIDNYIKDHKWQASETREKAEEAEEGDFATD